MIKWQGFLSAAFFHSYISPLSPVTLIITQLVKTAIFYPIPLAIIPAVSSIEVLDFFFQNITAVIVLLSHATG